MRRLSTIALLVLAVLVTAPAAFAAIITLNDAGTSSIEAIADDAIGSDSQQVAFPISLPAAGGLTATDGTSSSTTTYNLSNDGFNFTSDGVRDATLDSLAMSTGAIYFSSSTNVNYVLSGTYVSDATEASGTYMSASIYDETDSIFVFDNLQESSSTPGQSFTLGQVGGDFDNFLTSSLAGTLIAGHQYVFRFDQYIYSSTADATTSAHAIGYVNLALVPEPTTAALLGLGLTGVAAAGRQRRSPQ